MADSRVIKKRLNNSYRCGYCLHHFDKLEDPRTLPCLHVYCINCLKTDIGYKKTHIDCAYCRKGFYDITDPTTLPVAKLGDVLEYKAPPKPPPILCDVCEDGTEAVVFCVEIQKKLCKQHHKNHRELMGDRHQLIDIEVYRASPQRYTITECEHHKQEQLTKVCSKCHQIFCMRCDMKSGCNEGEAAFHDMTSLSDLSCELRESLTGGIETLSEKVTELNDISKNAWKELSKIEDGVKKMVARVNAVADAQIEKIRKRATNLRLEIYGYLKSCTQIVDNYRIELALSKTMGRQSLVDTVQHTVDKFNDARIVRGYREMSEKMKKATDIGVIEKCVLPDSILLPTYSEDSLGLKLLQPPASLQSDGLPICGRCGRVNISADGHLMCWTREGVEVLNRHTLDTISSVKHTNATWRGEIIQPEVVVVGSCYNREEETAEVSLLDPNSFEKFRCLYKQSVDKPTAYRIAQHLSLVNIVDWREKQLVVYNLVDNKIQKFPLPEMEYPAPVCILPDSTLLIGDYTVVGKVRRYKVENTTLTLMWEFPHISRPTGISFDPTSELIHICTAYGPLLILSLEGKQIVRIPRESLGVSSRVHDIVVYNGDEVFLGCGDDGLRRYTIKY